MRQFAVTTATLALAGLLAVPAAAQRHPIDAVYPDSSYGVLRFGGLERCRTAAERLGMFELLKTVLHEADIDPIVMRAHDLSEGTRHFNRELRRIGMDAEMLQTLLGGDVAIGFGRPTFYAAMTPSMVIALDTRGREDKIRGVLDRVETMLVQEAVQEACEWSSERFEGVEVRRFHAKRYGMLVSYAMADGILMVGTGTGYLKDCIRTMRGKVASIRQNPAYVRGAKLQRVDPLCSLFINCEPLGRMLEPLTPYEMPAFAELLGIEGMQGIYWATGTDEKGAVDTCYLGLPGNPKGLLKALIHRPSSLAAAKVAPANTVLFATARIDPKSLMETGRKLYQHLPGEAQRQLEWEFRRNVGRELGRELRHIGLTVQDVTQLLQLFGSEMSFAMSMPTKGAPLPGMTMFVELRDPQSAEATLLSYLERLLDGERAPRLRKRTVHGHDVHFVSVRAGL